MPHTPREEVRQEAARFLVESLGYPKETLAADVSLSNGHRDSFVADLLVGQPEDGSPVIVVDVFPPGSTPPQQIPPAVADSGARFYFWFDGFSDYPGRAPSWGSRYFERQSDGYYVTVPSIPHHHRPLRPRKRRPPTRHKCPSCGKPLDNFCMVPCMDNCPGWTCAWFRILHCRECDKSFPRPRGNRP